MSSLGLSRRESVPGLDSQTPGNQTYYHRSRQVSALSVTPLSTHELESLMTPLSDEAPSPPTDLLEVTEVHGLVRGHPLAERMGHIQRKVWQGLPGSPFVGLFFLACLVFIPPFAHNLGPKRV